MRGSANGEPPELRFVYQLPRSADECFAESRGTGGSGLVRAHQKQTPSTHVEKRQVIDGQQGLTTLQIFLAALRDFCREQTREELGVTRCARGASFVRG